MKDLACFAVVVLLVPASSAFGVNPALRAAPNGWPARAARAGAIVLQETVMFDTTVPAGSAAGAEVQVTTPDGQQMLVAVPEGLQPGDAFRIAYTPLGPKVPENYDEAEARGIELASDGEYERAIRMFELAQTLPGAGVDFNRQKQGGMIGSATAPPNPREWAETRFATPEQKMIAQYNIACCSAAMGDTPRAIELLRDYLSKVSEPLKQVNQMLVDDDLVALREDLRALREQYKAESGQSGGLFGFKNPIKDMAESIGVEWKD